MRLDFDLNVGALYIRLSDQPVVTTDEAGDNANVDLDQVGRVVGIEVTSAAHRWPLAAILDSYQISEAEAAQLRAYFLPQAKAQAAHPMTETLPVMEAEPTAPSVLAAA
jgi:uncharacterized protein YuzE